jgi:phenylalanyl-tRNA synthetase beta chain
MKVPLSWLRDYVEPLPPVRELIQRLTTAGLEVASAHVIGLPTPEGGLGVKAAEVGPVWERDKVVVGQVLRVEKHPNADKLKLVDVDYGGGQPKTVVTGADNIKVGDKGQKVALGLNGFEYFDGYTKPKTLKRLSPTTLRGIPSDAMLCSTLELGIDEEHAGIILLDAEVKVGQPLVDHMGDVVLEIDVLPNMARGLSMIGVAREVAALIGQTLRLPPHAPKEEGPAIEGKVTVSIANSQLSPRYAAALLQNVKLGEAPEWMRRRLTLAGMRPISNIVDITNYVMFEWGQPLHAFDYDKLVARAGGKTPAVVVRPAQAGEILKTLDGVERKLTPDMLVIADAAGAIALAGVMGGAETEVSSATKQVLLESANFDFLSIRRTMRALDLPSEASYRFSRGVHPEMVRPALGRAAELMRRYAGATVCRGFVDVYPAPLAPKVVDLRMSEVRRILGVDLPLDECARLLRALEYGVEPIGADVLRVASPPHRLDIQEGAADLIEDVVRLYGFDRLPPTLLADRLPSQSPESPIAFEDRVRDLLIFAGLQEVISYSLTTPEREAALRLPPMDYVTLKNPISSERTALRHSVLTGVLEATAANLKHTDDVRLFEIGAIYLPRPGQRLPDEARCLGVAVVGKRRPEFWEEGTAPNTPLDFYDLKGIMEALVAELHLADVSYQLAREAAGPPAALHPGKSAVLLVGSKAIGSFGELHPKTAEAFGLAGRTVLAGEFDLEALEAATPPRYRYSPLARFPAALRDVAVVVAEEVSGERVAAEIRAAGRDLLRGVRLFDLYRGEGVGAGRKSLAYALTYQADDRTLTDKEVDRAHRAIENHLRERLGAQIRGKDEG